MCANHQVPFLLLSGPPGVGKTTVAWELFGLLVARGEYPAMVDLDLLGACWPARCADRRAAGTPVELSWGAHG